AHGTNGQNDGQRLDELHERSQERGQHGGPCVRPTDHDGRPAASSSRVCKTTPCIEKFPFDFNGVERRVWTRFEPAHPRGLPPYCSTCTFSSVTRPLPIMPSRTGRNALIFSSLSTISMTTGRSSERRRVF